jgi:hypothetical protein
MTPCFLAGSCELRFWSFIRLHWVNFSPDVSKERVDSVLSIRIYIIQSHWKWGQRVAPKPQDKLVIIHTLRTQKTVSPTTPALKASKLMLLQNWRRGIRLLLLAAEYISAPYIGSILGRHVSNYWPECMVSLTRTPKSKFCPHECNLTVSQRICCWRLVCGTHSCDRWINAFKVGNMTWQHTT